MREREKIDCIKVVGTYNTDYIRYKKNQQHFLVLVQIDYRNPKSSFQQQTNSPLFSPVYFFLLYFYYFFSLFHFCIFCCFLFSFQMVCTKQLHDSVSKLKYFGSNENRRTKKILFDAFFFFICSTFYYRYGFRWAKC